MIRFLERYCQIVEVVAGLLLGAVTILIVASTIGRYLFARPIPDAFDLSRLMIGACVMWGFASVGYRGGHIKIDLFAEMMPLRVRRWVDAFAWSVLLFFVILLAWKILVRTESAFNGNESTFDLQIRVWPMFALIWVGAASAVITVAVRLILILQGRGSLEHSEASEFAEIEHGER
ncbi:MAG: TRAP transporter small permease [Salaquimonas sp.]|nr:TRAP transporter small permease [Salaquimonas sp.]